MSHEPAAAPVGVVLLNTRFPRLLGDIGNPASFDRPVLYRRVPAATVGAVVRAEGVEGPLAEAILAAAEALVAEGAAVIATSCGFLGELQDRLAAALPVPVAASALALLPRIRADLRTRQGPAARIGVLTFDSRRLKPLHFAGHWSDDLVVEGLERGRELFPVITEDRETLDRAAAEQDVAEAAQRLLARAGRLDAVVLECTNIGPYAERVRSVTGAAVHDLVGSLRAGPATT
ncbi:hypothetical protein SAMN06265365_12320 [Tistlia consotensis]|uniref:Aspartate/glutamate racemase family protein n=1 Tax=Tistlia consotensis USBA 355 TaxID=560819 RepID=A0A1Y6CII7_9PROT|nr:hypothetical protein [Tistlia consotensis]SMF64736.1 hypothetical protein SAMN05428998_12589 [Tistlia consotensis USBA 355]SNR96802.1 hypothetical protein SAMN06265365_12320 [Tistlia consotensis]